MHDDGAEFAIAVAGAVIGEEIEKYFPRVSGPGLRCGDREAPDGELTVQVVAAIAVLEENEVRRRSDWSVESEGLTQGDRSPGRNNRESVGKIRHGYRLRPGKVRYGNGLVARKTREIRDGNSP